MNTITELEKEIEALEQNKKDIDDKIVSIKKKIVVLKNSEKFLNVKTNENNKELFAFYLMENKNLSDRTVHHYYNALQIIKDMFLEEMEILIPTELYFIDDARIFALIVDGFKSSEKMMTENKMRHYDLSAAINNYHQFLLTLKEIR